MNNKQQSKVRFVRCPKCTKILQEPDHIPLYTCGGCGTILQAKNYKGPLKNTALRSHEQDVRKKNDVIHAREVGESSGSSRRSSSDHSSAQDKEWNSDGVGNFRNTKQNGATSSLANPSLSKESGFNENKENGEIDDIITGKFCSKSEQNGTASSSENTALSKDSCSIKNKENGVVDDGKSEESSSKSEYNGLATYAHQTSLSEVSDCRENKANRDTDGIIDQSDSKERVVEDSPTSLENEPRKLDNFNLVKEDGNGQDEECNDIVIDNIHQTQIKVMNSDREVLMQAKSKEEEEEDDDEDEEKLVRHVKSAQDISSVTEPSAIKNPAENHASDHELSEETWKTHVVGKQTHEDRHEQNQIGYMNSVKDDSSGMESPDIINPTHFVSENPAEIDASDQQQSKGIKVLQLVQKYSYQDVSKNDNLRDLDDSQVENRGQEYGNGTDLIEETSSLTASPQLIQLASKSSGTIEASKHDVSKETSKMDLVEAHFQQDTLGNIIQHLDAGVEVDTSGKETVDETDPNDITEQVESVQITSACSLSTVPIQGGNDKSVYVSTPSATDLKTSYEIEPTKASEDPLQHQRNSLDNMKGTSELNSKNVGKRVVNVDSKLGTFVKENPESSSKRSPAYDGSVSSFDGNDDKDAEQPPQVGKETLSLNNAVAGSDGAEGCPEWSSLPSEQKIFGNVRAQRPHRGSSTMASDDKLKSRVIEEEGPLEGHGIPRRFRPNRENFLPKVPYTRRSSEITYETGSTSSYALHGSSRHRMHPHHPYGRGFPEAPLWREREFLPTYYNSETSGEFYERPKHHSYMDRRRRTESWSQSGTLPRMPYSGEIVNGRYPYMPRYPEDRRWSAQLPLPAIYFHQGGYMNPGWETRWDPHDSYPTSPQRFMESESSCAWGHDTISLSDDQRHKDQIMRRMYLREKRQAVKTPFRPIAGGTPFITCNFCFHILQLPRNVILSRRRQRTHKLRCGACSRVLEFSLDNEGGLTACETILKRNVNLATSSHSHVNHSRQSSLNSADGRVLLSRDSLGASNREKRNRSAGSLRNGEKMEGLADDDDAPLRGRPPKVTWQLPTRSKSPLHKLMGYSSPNEMLTFHEADDVE